MGIVGLLISRGVRFMADGLNGPTNEEARELLEIRLEEAQARHAEDLERLGREMSEVVAQPLQARLYVARRVERDVRTALCASMSECTDVAARRVAGERDLARAERDMLSQACENWRKLDAPLSEFRRVLRVGDYESTLDAARRMSRELEVCLGQLDHVTAREKALRDRHVDAKVALGAKVGERLDVAARRVVAERDAARAIRDEAIARAEKAEAELEAARASASLVTMVGDIGVRNSGDATRLEAILAERDALAAELAAIRAATGEEPTDEVIARVADLGVNEGDARRALYNLGRNAALGEVARMREEVATLRDRVDGLEIDLNSAVQNAKAIEVEANNLRSANRTLRARVAELEAIAREAESQANGMVSQRIAALGVAVNGAADEEAVSPDVQVVRGDFVMTKFRERLARIEAASPPAPQGQPVEEANRHGVSDSGADRAGILAVAARVRAERPACLVARAVALNVDVRVAEDVTGFLVATLDSPGVDEAIERAVPAADVPATLARLLDEVEASRKAVAK